RVRAGKGRSCALRGALRSGRRRRRVGRAPERPERTPPRARARPTVLGNVGGTYAENGGRRPHREYSSRAQGAMSTPDSNTGLRTLLRPYLRRNRGRLAVLSSASLLGGFAEAAVLVVIARVAFAITQQHSSVTVSACPRGPDAAPVPALITRAAVSAP